MDTDQTDEDVKLWAWLAGLIDGEGCFTISLEKRPPSGYHTRMAVSLRADDWRALMHARDGSGLGRVRYVASTSQAPMFTWQVTRIDECLQLIAGLEAVGGLHGKKARDFALWAEAAKLIAEFGGGVHSTSRDRLAELKALNHALKPFSSELAQGSEVFRGVRQEAREGRGSKEHWASPAGDKGKLLRQKLYARLSQEQVDDIVSRVLAGERRKALAEEYGVSHQLIGDFFRGEKMHRDGTTSPLEAHEGPKASDPAFWKSEAGQRAHRNQAILRGKLTQAQIDEAVARYNAGGVTQKELAEEYGVSRPLIGKFVKGNYIRK